MTCLVAQRVYLNNSNLRKDGPILAYSSKRQYPYVKEIMKAELEAAGPIACEVEINGGGCQSSAYLLPLIQFRTHGTVPFTAEAGLTNSLVI